MPRILIIEDEKAIRNVLRKIISEENKDYEIEEAEDGLQGYENIAKKDFDLVLCDIKMPKMDGMEILQKTISEKPHIPFIMITGHGSIDTAVQSIKLGAFDFISKPPDLNRLLSAIRNALDRKKLIQENISLSHENKILKKKVQKKYEMIGFSDKLDNIKQMIEKVATTDARVLITGANGTGKELVAHSIHEKSKRSDKEIIEVNCAAIPSELIESELFGHVKGSFTGAIKDKAGKFELAHKGTLFLDEIGDMSLSAQAKVLRALQEGKISRVGGDKEIEVDVRVIAATNKDLAKEILEGKFREDLFHRLSVIQIKVPSLNERREDIPELVAHFSQLIAQEYGNQPKQFTDEAIKELQKADWTGNIRELRNVVERLIILGQSPVNEEDVKKYHRK